MRIDTKMTALLISPIYAKCANTFSNAVSSNPMNYAVGTVTNPFAVGNNFVRRLDVFAEIVEKSSCNFSVFNANVAVTNGNIFVN